MGLLWISSDHPGGDGASRHAPTMLILMYKPWHNGQLVIFLLQSVPENHSLSGDKFTHMLSVCVKSIKLFFLEKKTASSRAVFHSWHIDFRVKFLRIPTL